MPVRLVLLLLMAFAVSVAIRYPQLGRPMGKHHEFCTATALRVLTVWHQEGIASKGFNPATNFAGNANKYINNHASGSGQMVDSEGNYYYISHPPLAYYVPYGLFSLFGIAPDVLPLQLFNLLLHLLSGLGIYSLARSLLPENTWAPQSATLLYWFMHATLWFQSNVYMSDMAVQPLYIWASVLAVNLIRNPTTRQAWMLALVCALAAYTTWFGLLVGFSFGLFFLWRARKDKRYLAAFWAIGFSQVLVLGLIVWQYSQIAGWDAFVQEMGHRYAVRGIGSSQYDFLVNLLNYGVNYGGLALILVVGLFFRPYEQLKAFGPLIFPIVLPIFLMHLLLPDYTGHDFTTLYFAVPLSVWLGAYLSSLSKKWGYTLAVLCIGTNIWLYANINPYGATSYRGDAYNVYYNEAQLYAYEPADAIVFIIGATPSPETLWYAKRNVQGVMDEKEAISIMKERGISKGELFVRPNPRSEPNGKPYKSKTLSL